MSTEIHREQLKQQSDAAAQLGVFNSFDGYSFYLLNLFRQARINAATYHDEESLSLMINILDTLEDSLPSASVQGPNKLPSLSQILNYQVNQLSKQEKNSIRRSAESLRRPSDQAQYLGSVSWNFKYAACVSRFNLVRQRMEQIGMLHEKRAFRLKIIVEPKKENVAVNDQGRTNVQTQ